MRKLDLNSAEYLYRQRLEADRGMVLVALVIFSAWGLLIGYVFGRFSVRWW